MKVILVDAPSNYVSVPSLYNICYVNSVLKTSDFYSLPQLNPVLTWSSAW
jgi:hypothetical protein